MALTVEQARELGRCYASPEYFTGTYCHIYDSVAADWIPFDLWPAQRQALRTIHTSQLTIMLKARQIGLTWLCLAYALWQMLFRPIAAVGLFSRRDAEALYLLSKDRLRGMYNRLPEWMRSGHEATVDGGHEWALSNGSVARAFPTSAGDSYTNTLAFVDEAALAPDLNRLMRAVKPTIDNGGKLILLSRVDKSQPMGEFNMIYRAAVEGSSPWSAVFLPWYVHPGRTQAWYEAQKADVLSRTGSLDDLYEQYPATDTEALAPRSLDKRIASGWLEACFEKLPPIHPPDAPALPGLTIWREPVPFRPYVIGADPAEGNPTSDPSALSVRDAETGECVAELNGRIEPSVLASYANTLGVYYNHAAVMAERNNHGHAFILWMHDNSRLLVLDGHDGRPGWLSNSKGKALLYNEAADFYREHARNHDRVLHSLSTFQQLASIEGSTLRAPEGMHDDQADADALSIAGIGQAAVTAPVMVQARVRGRG